jgi:uncharacterized protein YwgA
MRVRLEYSTDVLLALLFSPAGAEEAVAIRGRTRLQKLLFLLGEEHNISRYVKDYYQYEPYRFGPFSAEVYRDVEFLENAGLIAVQAPVEASDAEADEEHLAYSDALFTDDEDPGSEAYQEQAYALTKQGRQVAAELWAELPDDVRGALREVKTAWQAAPLASLIRYVYRNFPSYATESELEWAKT